MNRSDTSGGLSDNHAELVDQVRGAMALNPQAAVVCVLVRSNPHDPLCETKLLGVALNSADMIAAAESILEATSRVMKRECDCAACATDQTIVADALALLLQVHHGHEAIH